MIQIIEYFKNASPGQFVVGIVVAALVIKFIISILED